MLKNKTLSLFNHHLFAQVRVNIIASNLQDWLLPELKQVILSFLLLFTQNFPQFVYSCLSPADRKCCQGNTHNVSRQEWLTSRNDVKWHDIFLLHDWSLFWVRRLILITSWTVSFLLSFLWFQDEALLHLNLCVKVIQWSKMPNFNLLRKALNETNPALTAGYKRPCVWVMCADHMIE